MNENENSFILSSLGEISEYEAPSILSNLGKLNGTERIIDFNKIRSYFFIGSIFLAIFLLI